MGFLEERTIETSRLVADVKRLVAAKACAPSIGTVAVLKMPL